MNAFSINRAGAQDALQPALTDHQITKFARLALEGLDREYPNKPSNVMESAADVLSPRDMHPVFFGNFDWHSSLHGHWMLIRLMKRYPDATVADEIEKVIDQRFTSEALQAEADYFNKRENRSFERMYGWAWTLRLATELHDWDSPAGRRWAANFRPLEDKIVELARGYLPRLDWPIRCGFHPESAFALAQMLDYARATNNQTLADLIVEKSLDFYRDDRDYPTRYEPSGNDFFSSGLNEADLMRRVLSKPEFSDWLDRFFPDLRNGKCGNLLLPVSVSDVTDGHLVHLAGLNLNRAWTMNSIQRQLGADSDLRKKVLIDSTLAHADAGLDYVFSGHYEGEHWLASFAVYYLTDVGN